MTWGNSLLFFLVLISGPLSPALDLLVGLISVTTDFVWKITVTWEAGMLSCKVVRYFQVPGGLPEGDGSAAAGHSG